MSQENVTPSDTTGWLGGQPWRQLGLPDEVAEFPSMLYPEERKLLFLLGREFRDVGQIIDAGCFIGGSTYALASGLEANTHLRRARPRVIHSYDLFRLDEQTKDVYPELVEGIEVGGSLRLRFDCLLASRSDYVNVYEGDIRGHEWNGGPIELLFLDICKTWEINDHVSRQFFPALIPERSIVVQQDFIHEWLPQIQVTMGLLADAFEARGFAAPGSVVFVPTRRIAGEEIPSDLRTELSDEDKLGYFDRACAPFGGEGGAILECAKADLLRQLGKHSEALALLDTVPTDISERVASSVREVRSWVLRSHPDPAISRPAWDRWHLETED